MSMVVISENVFLLFLEDYRLLLSHSLSIFTTKPSITISSWCYLFSLCYLPQSASGVDSQSEGDLLMNSSDQWQSGEMLAIGHVLHGHVESSADLIFSLIFILSFPDILHVFNRI